MSAQVGAISLAFQATAGPKRLEFAQLGATDVIARAATRRHHRSPIRRCRAHADPPVSPSCQSLFEDYDDRIPGRFPSSCVALVPRTERGRIRMRSS